MNKNHLVFDRAMPLSTNAEIK